MTCHQHVRGPGKGREAEPQLQCPPQPQQTCAQMATGLVPLWPAASAAAAAHINADAGRDTPEITGYTRQDFSSYAGKESFNPKLPGTAERLNASPPFCSGRNISIAMKWTPKKKVPRQKKANGKYRWLVTGRLANICVAESFCS